MHSGVVGIHFAAGYSAVAEHEMNCHGLKTVAVVCSIRISFNNSWIQFCRFMEMRFEIAFAIVVSVELHMSSSGFNTFQFALLCSSVVCILCYSMESIKGNMIASKGLVRRCH